MCLSLQGDIWASYHESCLWGRQIVTMGGSRGLSRVCYVPLLSGLQLFESIPEGEDLDDARYHSDKIFKAGAEGISPV